MTNSAKRVLLVDDFDDSRYSLSRLLEIEGYEVIEASDGAQAIERALNDKPDLILMDVEMPRMSGIEACRLLKENEATSKIPVVLMTMRGEESAVKKGFESGCSDYLIKPVNEEKLVAVLRKYLK